MDNAKFTALLRAAQLRAIRNGKRRAAEHFAGCIAKLRGRISETMTASSTGRAAAKRT